MTKIIVACVTADDLRTITDLATQPGNLVVAVVFDLGDGVRLRELQDQAHAAGAARCHVVDLRAEFALDYLLPVLQKAPEQQTDRFRALARACIARKLADLARLEGADAVYPLPETSAPMPFAVSRGAPSPDSSARIAISFEKNVPVAVNDVPMSIVEVLESLATIGSAHGLDGSDAGLRTLNHAYLSMAEAGVVDTARLEVSQGHIATSHATT